MKWKLNDIVNDTDVALDIEKDDLKMLEKEIVLSNIKRMQIIAWFVMVVEPLLIFFLDIPRLEVSDKTNMWIYESYLICHVVFLLAAIPALIFTAKIETKSKKVQLWSHRYMAIIVPLVALSMFGYIDILDQMIHNEGIVYLVNVIILSTVYMIKPPKNVFIFTIPHIIYISLNMLFFPEKTFFSASIVNSTTMIATLIVFNSILYNGFLNNIKKNFVLKRKNEELEYLASHDMLTKLNNRSAFGKYIEQNQVGILMLIDLDYFKHVNDTYSHLAGDYILTEFASLMKKTFYDAKMARWGGEEFILFLHETEMEEIMIRVEQFRVLLMKHVFEYEDKQIFMTASFGLTQIREDYDAAFVRMDRALYQAKEKGRNTMVHIPFS